MKRRNFMILSAGALLPGKSFAAKVDVAHVDRQRILKAAARYLGEAPLTITEYQSPRSAGGRNDYYSEGDYWWPDPANTQGPYVQRDGMTNPDNFVAHRHALIRLSLHVPALVAAWSITRHRRYADHALRHLRSWFLEQKTMMNPHLEYAQAIKGRATGRGIGIIDTIHLVEVVRAISILEESRVLSAEDERGLHDWVVRYLTWITTHPYGKDEREAKNNHGTCWVMQVAEFARYTRNKGLTQFCRDRYKAVLLPTQMAADGSFPLELRRTKPYGYSLFNLDAMAAVCQILSTPQENLWTYALPDGRGIAAALRFMFPYIADKNKWPYPPDVMYFDQWPVRHPGLLFGGLALTKPDYLSIWRKLNPDPTVDETVRNYFVRQPVLWLRR
jgi:hypothetical protein